MEHFFARIKTMKCVALWPRSCCEDSNRSFDLNEFGDSMHRLHENKTLASHEDEQRHMHDSVCVDAHQIYQTSRTTFSAALSAVPVTILARDMAFSLGQVSTKYPSRCRPKKNQIILTIRYRPSVKCRPLTGFCAATENSLA